MYKLYGLFEGSKLVATALTKQPLVEKRKALPDYIREGSFIAEKFIGGDKEHQQSHWNFNIDQND